MKWRDSDDHTRLGNKTAKDYLDEEDNPHWTGPDSDGIMARLIRPLKRYIPILYGVVLFVVVFGGLKLIYSRGNSTGGLSSDRLQVLEAKIRYLEEKYEKFDSIDNKVTRIWEQANAFENFKERFDRTEASMTLRMDHLATSIDAVQKRLSSAEKHGRTARKIETGRKKAPSKGTPASASVQYHTVKPKDTLYSISVKYGIKLDNLLKMNDMKKNTIIQPGQKLIVKK